MHRFRAALLLTIVVAGAARPGAAGGPAAPAEAHAAQPADRPVKRPAASLADVAYGTDSTRQRFDLWKAASARPAPLVLLIHGGGWRRGDKTGFGAAEIRSFLDAGISVAALNYRFIDECMAVSYTHLTLPTKA